MENNLEMSEHRTGANLQVKQQNNDLGLQWVMGYSYSRIKVGEDATMRFRNEGTGEIILDNDVKYAGFARGINSLFGQVKWEAFSRE